MITLDAPRFVRRSLRRLLLHAVLWPAAFFVALFVALFAAPRAWADHALVDVTLQLRWTHQFQFAGYYAAQKMGFYRDAGLNVRIEEGGPGRDVVPAVLQGEAQFGVSNSEILLDRLKNKPLVVLAAIFQHSPLVFVLPGESDIKTPQDLIGRKVKMSTKGRDVELQAMFLKNGVTLDQLDLVDGFASVDDYFNGAYNAVGAYLTNQPYYLESKNKPYRIMRPKDFGIDFYGDCLFTAQEYIDQHPDRVEAFTKASLKGWEYALQNPEELVDIIIKEYGATKSRAHLLYEARRVRELTMPTVVALGHINPARWEHIAEVFSMLGMVEGSPSLEGFIFQTDDEKKLRWLWRGLLLTVVLLAAALLIAAYMSIFTRRLKKEIKKRELAQQSLKESEAKFRAIFEHAGIGLTLADMSGHTIQVNPAFIKMLGYTNEELSSMPFSEYTYPDDINKNMELFNELVQGEREHYSMEKRYQAKNGAVVWGQLTVSMIRETADNGEGEQYVVAMIENVTDRKRAEKDLEDVNKNLEKLVDERTEALNQRTRELECANQELLQVDELKSSFLSTVSHDLRTPMTSILGFVKLIERDFDRICIAPEESDAVLDRKKEQVRSNLGIIRQEGERLTRLINNFLDLTKIEAGSYEWKDQSVHMHELAASAAESLRGMLVEKPRITFLQELEESPSVHVDPDCIQQVLANLLSNAVKFTEQGEIRLKVSPAPGPVVRVSVTDTGVGVSKEDQERIFSKYYQAGTTEAHEVRGTGMGLAICREIVKRYGGNIWVESESGKGSSFIFEIPVNQG